VAINNIKCVAINNIKGVAINNIKCVSWCERAPPWHFLYIPWWY